MRLIARFTLYGNTPRKSNQREIAKVNGRTIVRKSDKAILYGRMVKWDVPHDCLLGYDGPVLLVATIYYQSRRSDLSLELPSDALQTEYVTVKSARGGKMRLKDHEGNDVVQWNGVYRDDRQVKAVIARKLLDPKNPRAEFSVYALDDEQPWKDLDHDAWCERILASDVLTLDN